MALATINGSTIHYETKGSGDPVVFIHSGGFDFRIWDEQFDSFAERYRTIRYNVRGYGMSAPPTRPYSDEEDLRALLHYLGVQKAHLVGLSLGGRIAIDFALTHPQMTASLTAVAPGVSGALWPPEVMMELLKVVYSIQNDDGHPAGEVWLQSVYNAPAMENPKVAEKLRPIALENSRVWLINPLFPVPPFPPAIQRLPHLSVLSLLVVGDRDLPFINSVVQSLEDSVPGSRKVVVPGAGHMVPIEKPEEFNLCLQQFLDGLDRCRHGGTFSPLGRPPG